jgi:uncharacterized tellurite resistance protein B-like protein
MADVNLSAAGEAISAGTTQLRFTDSELQIVSEAVRHLPPQARSALLHALAGLLPADHGSEAVEVAVRAVCWRRWQAGRKQAS